MVVWGGYYLEMREVRVVGSNDEGERYVSVRWEGVACKLPLVPRRVSAREVTAEGFGLRASS